MRPTRPGTAAVYGAVGYDYNIGTYDVTLTQYTAFLNSVAATDTYGLYNPSLATDLTVRGISRSGSPGSFSYAVIGDGQRPVTYVSWYDAVRFTNWLTDGNTETGAYTITNWNSSAGTGMVTVPSTTQRAAWAGGSTEYWYLPDEDEWYKAAYFDPTISGSNQYWQYPTRSNSAPTNNLVGSGSNSANFYNGVYATTQLSSYSSNQNYLTDVGAYSGSPGPWGTYDMGGDVFQWNDLDASTGDPSRGWRGGYWYYDSGPLGSGSGYNGDPTLENAYFGFRVASNVAIPEPGSLALLGTALAGLGTEYVRRRRSR